ncbi:DNA polymerase III subunit gamma/tau, partial [Candidatus Saccharibacteria bacterium]|nr:DNA polymerase III subunit gamma/tau [Candidatus Saccharibacteria bacterium]
MRALYRRYRSKSLDDIVGQEATVAALKRALESGKLHHAYLLSGARGTGKTSVARILAHMANDFTYELEATHPDIIEIDAASNTGVDNIRELIERAALAPTAGKYKIYIIDEVHMLSKSAFNALLKTLEEPPTSVIFILATTDPEKVPITIMSRVQHFKFGLADSTTVAKHLRMVAGREKILVADEALEFLAESSGGSFRDALSLLEQANAVAGGGGTISREALETAFGVPALSDISNLVEAFNVGDRDAISDILDNGIGNQKAFVEGLARHILKTPTANTLALLDDLINTLKAPAIDPLLQIRLVFLKRVMPQTLSSESSDITLSDTMSPSPVATGKPPYESPSLPPQHDVAFTRRHGEDASHSPAGHYAYGSAGRYASAVRESSATDLEDSPPERTAATGDF